MKTVSPTVESFFEGVAAPQSPVTEQEEEAAEEEELPAEGTNAGFVRTPCAWVTTGELTEDTPAIPDCVTPVTLLSPDCFEDTVTAVPLTPRPGDGDKAQEQVSTSEDKAPQQQQPPATSERRTDRA